MRPALLALALCGCAAAQLAGPDPVLPPRAAEMARVRCLLVAPLENVSDMGPGAEAATAAILAGIDPDRTRVYPVQQMRALFRGTQLELPEGLPPSLAMELAEILGADAALYGAVEGRSRGADGTLVVTLRLVTVGSRDLLLSATVVIEPQADEPAEAAVRRAVEAATRPVLSSLGSPPPPRDCYDPVRFARLRAIATGHAARTPPPAAPGMAAAAGLAPSPASRSPGSTSDHAGAAAAPSRLPKPVPPRNGRQADWAKKLAAHQRFVLEGMFFEGRSSRLVRKTGLADLAGALAAAPEVNVRLEGFVDATADPGKDAQLSLAMARAVGQKLLELGLSKERVSWAGRGGERPILPNFTAKGRAANRRIEAVGLR